MFFYYMFPQISSFDECIFSPPLGATIEMTISVCHRSPAINTVKPPVNDSWPLISCKVLSSSSKQILRDIVTSSNTNNLHYFKVLASLVFFDILHIVCSSCVKFNGNFKAEWGIQPPFRFVAAISGESYCNLSI